MITVIESFKIVGLAVDRTKPSRNRDAAAMRQMHLQLSGSPDGDWIRIFDEERKFPRHSGWRHAWIDRNCIVIDCVPDEIEKCHLSDLKTDVENTNRKFAELQQQRHQNQQKKRAEQDAERAKLNELAGKLKFD